jgi:hypothetical protein
MDYDIMSFQERPYVRNSLEGDVCPSRDVRLAILFLAREQEVKHFSDRASEQAY